MNRRNACRRGSDIQRSVRLLGVLVALGAVAVVNGLLFSPIVAAPPQAPAASAPADSARAADAGREQFTRIRHAKSAAADASRSGNVLFNAVHGGFLGQVVGPAVQRAGTAGQIKACLETVGAA